MTHAHAHAHTHCSLVSTSTKILPSICSTKNFEIPSAHMVVAVVKLVYGVAGSPLSQYSSTFFCAVQSSDGMALLDSLIMYSSIVKWDDNKN